MELTEIVKDACPDVPPDPSATGTPHRRLQAAEDAPIGSNSQPVRPGLWGG